MQAARVAKKKCNVRKQDNKIPDNYQLCHKVLVDQTFPSVCQSTISLYIWIKNGK